MTFIQKQLRKQIAKQIDKSVFLSQLKSAWYPVIESDCNVETEVANSSVRIKKSGFSKVFDTVGITTADIRQVITEIVKEKNDQKT